jgi:hypothetical protein
MIGSLDCSHFVWGNCPVADQGQYQGKERRPTLVVEAIHGMIGSLDCSHFVWGNCPVADQGQYQGKERRPTLVVEALADHNLFAWHAVFRYCGMLNDLGLGGSSFLLQSLCNGSFSKLDFSFTIGGEVFHQLWMLLDGIYPSLARFVKPISVPIEQREALFSMWQESKQKDFEHFGVLSGNFIFSTGQYHECLLTISLILCTVVLFCTTWVLVSELPHVKMRWKITNFMVA